MLQVLIYFFQLPPGTQNPDDNTPIDFANPFEVLVYIILPLLIIAGYIFWKRKKKRDRKDTD